MREFSIFIEIWRIEHFILGKHFQQEYKAKLVFFLMLNEHVDEWINNDLKRTPSIHVQYI